MVRREPHARFHLAATLAVVAIAWWLGCAAVEWALLVLAIGAVWTAEALNTAMERLCDRVQPEIDESIRAIKDVAAGGVLAASMAAFVVGSVILVPKLMVLLEQ